MLKTHHCLFSENKCDEIWIMSKNVNKNYKIGLNFFKLNKKLFKECYKIDSFGLD